MLLLSHSLDCYSLHLFSHVSEEEFEKAPRKERYLPVLSIHRGVDLVSADLAILCPSFVCRNTQLSFPALFSFILFCMYSSPSCCSSPQALRTFLLHSSSSLLLLWSRLLLSVALSVSRFEDILEADLNDTSSFSPPPPALALDLVVPLLLLPLLPRSSSSLVPLVLPRLLSLAHGDGVL